ncbi:MAG: hypothetical protein LBO66_11830 [Deltaproteobacteria bacterium]|jgi:ActR/RegA family two-component response regulator|nr:hypothetical protein [Deltaproteobacteria bacterium]
MRVVIVDREPSFLATLIDELTKAEFEVTVVENISGVLSFIKARSLHFLVADASLLVDHTLGAEVRRQYPLTRLIVLASRPSLMGMVEAITLGVTDYFPRDANSFGQLVDTMVDERDKLMRWQYALLSSSLGKKAFSALAERERDPREEATP